METAKIMNTIVLQKMVDKLCTEKDAAVHSAAKFIKENIKQRQEILKLTARIAELEKDNTEFRQLIRDWSIVLDQNDEFQLWQVESVRQAMLEINKERE